MDAKAKVVRWECRPLNWEVQYQQRDDGEWVKFTDHEAALAELMAECEKRGEGLVFQSQGWEEANERLATLLTGLEALAGEIEAAAGHTCATAQENWARRIRTLASAGLEGNS